MRLWHVKIYRRGWARFVTKSCIYPRHNTDTLKIIVLIIYVHTFTLHVKFLVGNVTLKAWLNFLRVSIYGGSLN